MRRSASLSLATQRRRVESLSSSASITPKGKRSVSLLESLDLPSTPIAKFGGACSCEGSSAASGLSVEATPPVRTCAVRVLARFRPPVAAEEWHQEAAFVCESAEGYVRSADFSQTFQFDRVFDQDASQEAVYDEVGRAVVQDALAGYNGTILAYGQTGSGKTHCMFGPFGEEARQELCGLVPRAVEEIFAAVGNSTPGSSFIECSFLEVYNEQLRDLLRPKHQALQVKENPKGGTYVDGLTQKAVSSVAETLQLLKGGLRLRADGKHAYNEHSSRSHAIFTLRIQQRLEGGYRDGKLTLVDLAGSEKVLKTGVTGAMLEEAKKINSSLSALGNVIDALADKRPHIPYRDSKLTRVLEDSLGGNCGTTLIVACSPTIQHAPETLSSLRFAARAKKVMNYVHQNFSSLALSAEIADRQLLQRIAVLERDLERAHRDLEKRIGTKSSLSPADVEAVRTKARKLSLSSSLPLRLPHELRQLFRSRTEGSLTPATNMTQASVASDPKAAEPEPRRTATHEAEPLDAAATAAVPVHGFGSVFFEEEVMSPKCSTNSRETHFCGASREDRPAREPAPKASTPAKERGLRGTFSRATASSDSCCGSGVGISPSSTSLGVISSNTPSLMTQASWRHFEEEEIASRQSIKWLVEATPLNNHGDYFQRELLLERAQRKALIQELELRKKEMQVLHQLLEGIQARGGSASSTSASPGEFTAATLQDFSPRLSQSASNRGLFLPLGTLTRMNSMQSCFAQNQRSAGASVNVPFADQSSAGSSLRVTAGPSICVPPGGQSPVEASAYIPFGPSLSLPVKPIRRVASIDSMRPAAQMTPSTWRLRASSPASPQQLKHRSTITVRSPSPMVARTSRIYGVNSPGESTFASPQPTQRMRFAGARPESPGPRAMVYAQPHLRYPIASVQVLPVGQVRAREQQPHPMVSSTSPSHIAQQVPVRLWPHANRAPQIIHAPPKLGSREDAGPAHEPDDDASSNGSESGRGPRSTCPH